MRAAAQDTSCPPAECLKSTLAPWHGEDGAVQRCERCSWNELGVMLNFAGATWRLSADSGSQWRRQDLPPQSHCRPVVLRLWQDHQASPLPLYSISLHQSQSPIVHSLLCDPFRSTRLRFAATQKPYIHPSFCFGEVNLIATAAPLQVRQGSLS